MNVNGKTWKRIAAEALPFLALWAAYVAFGIWLRRQIPLEAFPGEVHGFDYNGYGILLSDHRLILFTRFRHPLFGWLLSPIPLFGERIARISPMAFWAYLSAIFSAIVTLGVWMVYRIAAGIDGVGRLRAAACTAVFACFGYVRYLAAVPESFSVSMLLALAVLWWSGSSPFKDGREKPDRGVWAVLAFLAGGVTITQGLKVVFAYVASRRVGKRGMAWICGGAAAIASVAIAFYLVKIRLIDDGATLAGRFEELFSSMPHELTWRTRLRMLEMFFCEPIVPHGVPYEVSEIVSGYASWWPYAVCGAVYALALVGAWRMRRTLLMRVMASMFAVDVVIHLVFFWGMSEAQIYCGHWFYTLPLLAAGALRRNSQHNP